MQLDLLTSLKPFDAYSYFSTYSRIRRELHDLIARTESSYPLDVRFAHATNGSLKFPDAYVLTEVLRKYRPRTILEIGSFLGFSTRLILETTREWSPGVTAIDPNIRHRVFDDPRHFVEELNSGFYPGRLEIVTGFFGSHDGSVYYDYEHYEPKKDRAYVDELIKDRLTIDRTWNHKFDLIFIDGDHSYESVMNNFETAISLLTEKGTIVFHDALSWEGVNRALCDIKAEYGDKADVSICGRIDRILLKPFRVNNDGIGFFRLLS